MDLRDLRISWDNLFKKNQGQDISATFVASAPQTVGKDDGIKVKIDRFDLRAAESTASMTGFVTREENGDVLLDTKLVSRAVLSQLYDFAPSLRTIQSKVPAGTVITNLQINGTYKMKDGAAGSPLGLDGRIVLKSPRAVLLDMAPAADLPDTDRDAMSNETTKADSAKDAMLKWPLLARSKLIFDVQIETIAVKTTALKNVALLANLENGNLRGSMSLSNLFGGPAKVTSFAVLDLPKRAFRDLKAIAAGNFQSLNLGLLAEFFSPKWKSLVGGTSSNGWDAWVAADGRTLDQVLRKEAQGAESAS